MSSDVDSQFEVRSAAVGEWKTNAYVLVDRSTGEAAVIDPGDEPEKIVEMVQDARVKYILFTHTHPDHVGAFSDVAGATQAPAGVHPLDASGLPNPVELSLEDGSELKLGSGTLHILYTPGHTPGGISILTGRHLFSGDTIFPGGPGWTAGPEEFRQIVASLESKIYSLPADTLIHPGHGDGMTVAESKQEYERFKRNRGGEAVFGTVTWSGRE